MIEIIPSSQFNRKSLTYFPYTNLLLVDGARVFCPHHQALPALLGDHGFVVNISTMVQKREMFQWMYETFGAPSLVYVEDGNKSYIGPDSIYSAWAKWFNPEDEKFICIRDEETLLRFKLRYC